MIKLKKPDLLKPRHITASAKLPGSEAFWSAMLDCSDLFSYQTAADMPMPKGGPFGAQLWLVNDTTSPPTYIPVFGGAEDFNDSNAVVSKGVMRAHAENENLSPEKRAEVINFLKNHNGEGWKVVQVSSGESCQSCRANQVAFAQELINLGLIEHGDFFVAFKATYEQTKKDAEFDDAPYDMSYRAINALGLLDDQMRIWNHRWPLLNLNEAIQHDKTAYSLHQKGDLITVPLEAITSDRLTRRLREEFSKRSSGARKTPDTPYAVVVAPNGSILSEAEGATVNHESFGIQMPEYSVITRALDGAANNLRSKGQFDSWNFPRREGRKEQPSLNSRLITNVSDIGPASYGNALWVKNLDIQIVMDHTSPAINEAASEIHGISTSKAWALTIPEYNDPVMPVRVKHVPGQARLSLTFEDANLGQVAWRVRQEIENRRSEIASRLSRMKSKVNVLINGEFIDAQNLVPQTSGNCDYNGARASVPSP